MQAVGQVNLVFNPSFEDTISCPVNGWITHAANWLPFSSSPDYYNGCVNPSFYGYSVPNNFSGTQFAASGQAYAGAISYIEQETNYSLNREILGGNLTTLLTIGQKYYVSFKVVAVPNTPNIGSSIFIDKLGVLFSTVTYTNIDSTTIPPIENFAHVYSDSIITDTTNWTTIFGSFVADSAYAYISVGNFFKNSSTDTVHHTYSSYPNSYYLFDDICVSTDSAYAANYSYTGISETLFNNQFSFYPDPAKDFFTIQNSFDALFDVAIYNSIGQLLCIVHNVNSDNLQLDISEYNKGLLLMNITSQNNQLMYKLLKQSFMKNFKLKLVGIFALSLLSASTFAQLNWQKGGNANFPFGAPPTIGTDITWNSPLNFVTRGVQRMTILGGLPGGATTGFVGVNIVNPLSRFHINENLVEIGFRLTNPTSGSLINDGFTFNMIDATSDFRFTQLEDANTDIWNFDAVTGGTLRRFRLQGNGQLFFGTPIVPHNNGGAIAGFSQAPTSLLNVRGPINSCEQNGSAFLPTTILYGYTTVTGNPEDPALDGYRFKYNWSTRAVNNDYLIIEKTDGQSADPDGGILFENTGNDGVEQTSLRINGQGRTYFGQTDVNPQINRVTIESMPGDATPSGLRLFNLPGTAASLVPNPGPGVLSVAE